jgi:hypothetical protein
VYTLRRRWLGNKPYWFCQAFGWGIVLATQLLTYLMQPEKDTTLSLEILFLIYLVLAGTLVTHLMRVVYIRLRNKRPGWKGLILSTALWCYYASLGLSGATFAVMILGDPQGVEKSQIQSCYGIQEFANFTIGCWISFICWSVFYFGALTYRRYRDNSLKLLQMDAALKDAKLRALKAQVNPHFLFNSLNTVRAMIPHDLASPRNAVTTLADFLRASLTSDDKPMVPFSEELEVVRNYLSMEKLRLEERLVVSWDIDAAAKSWPVPPFLFQTVVENAVKYGVARNENGGPIRISAQIVQGCLVLSVINAGRMDQVRVSTGLGIRNSRDRLALLYGQQASLTLEQTGPDEVTARIVLPFFSEDEYSEQ